MADPGDIDALPPPAAMPPADAFVADVNAMRAWWVAPIVAARPDDAIAPTTIDAHVSRLLAMRSFVEAQRGAPLLRLAALLADTPDTLERYLEHRAATVGPGTLALDCSSWLAALKWLHRGAYDPANPPEFITAVRRLHSQQSRAFNIDLRSRSDRKSLAAAGKWASW